jgi:DNA processing protein
MPERNAAETLARLRLVRTPGVGPLTYRRLAARYPQAADALEALPAMAQAGGRARLEIHPKDAAERELAALRTLGAHLLFLGDRDYPPLLTLLPDAPPFLAVLGNAALLRSARTIGIVGARNASANGMRLAEALATDLASRGVTVVSGMARGIDAAAHEGALALGQTVATIAGGLDQPYPPEHAALQTRIAERGAVVAEAPLGTAPQSRHFPRRNRIIAGLSLGLVVVEAALRSGSLITARLAQDADRELFAVPGSPLDPRCHGSNDLIRQGAHLTESAADVLAHLPDHPGRQGLGRLPLFASGAPDGFAEPPATTPALGDHTAQELAAVRTEILALLGPAPTDIDEVIRRSQFPASAIMAALSQLELALRMEVVPGNRAVLLPGPPPHGPGRQAAHAAFHAPSPPRSRPGIE